MYVHFFFVLFLFLLNRHRNVMFTCKEIYSFQVTLTPLMHTSGVITLHHKTKQLITDAIPFPFTFVKLREHLKEVGNLFFKSVVQVLSTFKHHLITECWVFPVHPLRNEVSLFTLILCSFFHFGTKVALLSCCHL